MSFTRSLTPNPYSTHDAPCEFQKFFSLSSLKKPRELPYADTKKLFLNCKKELKSLLHENGSKEFKLILYRTFSVSVDLILLLSDELKGVGCRDLFSEEEIVFFTQQVKDVFFIRDQLEAECKAVAPSSESKIEETDIAPRTFEVHPLAILYYFALNHQCEGGFQEFHPLFAGHREVEASFQRLKILADGVIKDFDDAASSGTLASITSERLCAYRLQALTKASYRIASFILDRSLSLSEIQKKEDKKQGKSAGIFIDRLMSFSASKDEVILFSIGSFGSPHQQVPYYIRCLAERGINVRVFLLGKEYKFLESLSEINFTQEEGWDTAEDSPVFRKGNISVEVFDFDIMKFIDSPESRSKLDVAFTDLLEEKKQIFLGVHIEHPEVKSFLSNYFQNITSQILRTRIQRINKGFDLADGNPQAVGQALEAVCTLFRETDWGLGTIEAYTQQLPSEGSKTFFRSSQGILNLFPSQGPELFKNIEPFKRSTLLPSKSFTQLASKV